MVDRSPSVTLADATGTVAHPAAAASVPSTHDLQSEQDDDVSGESGSEMEDDEEQETRQSSASNHAPPGEKLARHAASAKLSRGCIDLLEIEHARAVLDRLLPKAAPWVWDEKDLRLSGSHRLSDADIWAMVPDPGMRLEALHPAIVSLEREEGVRLPATSIAILLPREMSAASSAVDALQTAAARYYWRDVEPVAHPRASSRDDEEEEAGTTGQGLVAWASSALLQRASSWLRGDSPSAERPVVGRPLQRPPPRFVADAVTRAVKRQGVNARLLTRALRVRMRRLAPEVAARETTTLAEREPGVVVERDDLTRVPAVSLQRTPEAVAWLASGYMDVVVRGSPAAGDECRALTASGLRCAGRSLHQPRQGPGLPDCSAYCASQTQCPSFLIGLLSALPHEFFLADIKHGPRGTGAPMRVEASAPEEEEKEADAAGGGAPRVELSWSVRQMTVGQSTCSTSTPVASLPPGYGSRADISSAATQLCRVIRQWPGEYIDIVVQIPVDLPRNFKWRPGHHRVAVIPVTKAETTRTLRTAGPDPLESEALHAWGSWRMVPGLGPADALVKASTSVFSPPAEATERPEGGPAPHEQCAADPLQCCTNVNDVITQQSLSSFRPDQRLSFRDPSGRWHCFKAASLFAYWQPDGGGRRSVSTHGGRWHRNELFHLPGQPDFLLTLGAGQAVLRHWPSARNWQLVEAPLRFTAEAGETYSQRTPTKLFLVTPVLATARAQDRPNQM